jgi:hypothetical protein
MTGSFRIELNGDIQKQYGSHGHIEGIELADIVWSVYGSLNRGDEFKIICELEE